MAYPVGLAVALGAYTWFAIYFPKYLEQIYPAFDASSEEYGGKIKKWAELVANRFWVIGLSSLLVGLLNYLNLDALWQREIWLGDVWAASPAPWFFKSYYVLIDIIAGGFVLGSGVVGILGVMLLLHDLLSLRLKIYHVRDLRPIASLSIGLSFWALLAFAFVGPIRAVSAPNILCVRPSILRVDSAIVLANFGTSILASIAVVCSLLLPVCFAHRAIVRDKKLPIANLVKIQAGLFAEAERLSDLYRSALAERELDARKKGARELEQELRRDLQQTYESIAEFKKMIEEVDSIPEWPITAGGVRRIIVAAISPTLVNLIISLLPGQTGPTFTDVLKDAVPGIIKGLFE
jgi:hypothetical protein